MTGFALRDLTERDAAEVAALIRGAFAAYDPPLAPPPSALRETAESVARAFAYGGRAAVAAGAIIGVLLWEPRECGLYVGRLSVAPAWRRKGVARALLAAAEAHARRAGHSRLHAGVRLALTGNRALFASLGFVETRQQAHDGYVAPTWVEVEKHLA
jgi:GNAT superfamily N-acetyltransferase